MKRCLLSIPFGILVVVSSALNGAEGTPVDPPLKKAEVRAILEAGKTANSLPEGVFVRVEAQLSRSVPASAAVRSEAEQNGADFKKALRETWEFTSNQVHRVVVESSGEKAGNSIYRRVESAPFDSSVICRALLDAKIFAFGEEKPGEHLQFVGTDYNVGHRSIQIFVDGRRAHHVGESCLVAGYAEADARAFATLYESLAEKARGALGEHAIK